MFYVKNVPAWERVVRVVVGAFVVALAVTVLKGLLAAVVAVSAVGIVVSGLVGFCPACALVGRRLAKQPAKH
jgi:hypothetical protein